MHKNRINISYLISSIANKSCNVKPILVSDVGWEVLNQIDWDWSLFSKVNGKDVQWSTYTLRFTNSKTFSGLPCSSGSEVDPNSRTIFQT